MNRTTIVLISLILISIFSCGKKIDKPITVDTIAECYVPLVRNAV